MSHIAAKMIGLYFPTPLDIVKSIAHLTSIQRTYGNAELPYRIIDPCAGDGEALAVLTEELRECFQQQMANQLDTRYLRSLAKFETYGIEPEFSRAKVAATRLDFFLNASFEGCKLSNADSGNGGWGFWFFNPPYDDDKSSDVKERIEIKMLRRSTLKIAHNGILAYIIPQYILEDETLVRHLVAYYTDIEVWRFPDEEYKAFKQVVILAKRRSSPAQVDKREVLKLLVLAKSGVGLRPLPSVEEIEQNPHIYRQIQQKYAIPAGHPTTEMMFKAGAFNPDMTALNIAIQKGQTLPTAGVWQHQDYQEERWPTELTNSFHIGRPIIKLKPEHIAVLVSAGIANEAQIVGKDGMRVLIKGYCRKIKIHTEWVDEEEKKEVMQDTERFKTSLTMFDLDSGKLYYIETNPGAAIMAEKKKEGATGVKQEGTTPPLADVKQPSVFLFDVPYEVMPLGAFLDNFGQALTEHVERSHPPLYTGEEQVPHMVEAAKDLKRSFMGKQSTAAYSLALAMQGQQPINGKPAIKPLHGLGNIAEMSAGKTQMAAGQLYLADPWVNGHMPTTYRPIQTHFFPALVFCPPILPDKWKRELEMIIPNVQAVVISRISTPEQMAALQAFDPTYDGTTPLSAVGCLDRVVHKMRHDLDGWQKDYDEWEKERIARSKAIKHWKATVWWEWKQKYVEGARINPAEPHEPHIPLRDMPRKPAHVGILTVSTAKLDMYWHPVYGLKLMEHNGRISRNQDGKPMFICTCTVCGQPVQDVALFKRMMKEKKRGSSKAPTLKAKYRDNVLTEIEQMVLASSLSPDDMLAKRIKRECSNPKCGAPLWTNAVSNRSFAPPELPKYGNGITPKVLAAFLKQTETEIEASEEDALLAAMEALENKGREEEEGSEFLMAMAAPVAVAPAPTGKAKAKRRELPRPAAQMPFLDRRMKKTEQTFHAPMDMPIAAPVQPDDPEAPIHFFSQREYVKMVKYAVEIPDDVTKAILQPKDAKKRHMALADHILSHYKYFFKTLVIDEGHQGGSATAHRFAIAALSEACKNTVELTGTFFGGKAGQLFPQLYSINPAMRKVFSFDGLRHWVQLYGAEEITTKSKIDEDGEDDSENGAMSKRRGTPTVREIPALSPMAWVWTLPYCIFISLPEVAPKLPPYTEEVIEIKMDKNLKEEYRTFRNDISKELALMLVRGDKTALAAWFVALMTYPDAPYNGFTCRVKTTGVKLGTAKALPFDQVYAKEQAMLDEIFDENRLKGRGVLVFIENSGKEYDISGRIRTLIEQEDRKRRADPEYKGRYLPPIRVSVLPASVDTRKREKWLADEVAKGTNVVICNPALVQVGLDLIDFPTIIFFQTGKRTDVMRQAARRSYRLTQKRKVRVLHLVYEDSMQESLLMLMADKVRQALMAEGQLPTDGVASHQGRSSGGDMIASLAKQLLAEMRRNGNVGDNIAVESFIEDTELVESKPEFDINHIFAVSNATAIPHLQTEDDGTFEEEEILEMRKAVAAAETVIEGSLFDAPIPTPIPVPPLPKPNVVTPPVAPFSPQEYDGSRSTNGRSWTDFSTPVAPTLAPKPRSHEAITEEMATKEAARPDLWKLGVTARQAARKRAPKKKVTNMASYGSTTPVNTPTLTMFDLLTEAVQTSIWEQAAEVIAEAELTLETTPREEVVATSLW